MWLPHAALVNALAHGPGAGPGMRSSALEMQSGSSRSRAPMGFVRKLLCSIQYMDHWLADRAQFSSASVGRT
eukprot:351775-Chlamydomonas_euryale.AAC.6